MADSVFKDLKIADFSWVAAGPLVTKYLADYGATVVRVESTHKPDVLRTSAPYKNMTPGINRSGYWAYWNANKLSLSLDLSRPEGIAIAHRLVSWSDIVIENFSPGKIDTMGLGYEALKKIKPGLIMVSTSMQGQKGPHSKHPGVGPLLSGLVGIVNLVGWPDRGPVQAAGGTDIIAADLTLAALVQTLIRREQTGEGAYLDISQCEATLYSMAPLLLEFFANGNEGQRTGNSSSHTIFQGAFRCQGEDRWCTLSIFGEDDWQSLCNTIGLPELIKTYSTTEQIRENCDSIGRLVESWTIKHTREDVMKTMQQAKLCAGMVQNSEDVLSDPQLRHRNTLWLLNHSEIGPFYHMGQTFILSETPAQPRLPAPCLGENTEYVCREILGMKDAEFVSLLNQGVFS